MSKSQTKPSQSKFVRFFIPLQEVLIDLGGSGSPDEAYAGIIEKLNIPEHEQQELMKSGQTRVYNQIHWARFYLAKAGYIDSSKRGVWSLTERGLKEKITPEIARQILITCQTRFSSKDKVEIAGADDAASAKTDSEGAEANYKFELLSRLKKLPAAGFERFCQRMLREAGFIQVAVTGRSGDGGIDGYGILQVNPLVSFRVLFQCKKYEGSVATGMVRDFRGAMAGRADKGIIITTGTFTADAKKESQRDGAAPIELIDGVRLITMCETLELGLRPVTSFEIVPEFFEEFDE